MTTPLTTSYLLELPNELLLYILRSFLDLQDLWCLYGTSKELRYFASTVIKTTWKIDVLGAPHSDMALMKLQCRAALISLSSIALSHKELVQREKKLHAKIMKGISSYQHKYVLIQDIDIRNRIRTTVDVIFHHAIFVSAIHRTRHNPTRALAAILVRLLTELDMTFPSYCREITYTCADNIKAFLEFSGYKIMTQHHQEVTLHSLWALFDFMGAACLGKILSDGQLQWAVQRTCELLSTFNLVSFKKSLLVNLLDHWLLKRSSELIRSIQFEIEK